MDDVTRQATHDATDGGPAARDRAIERALACVNGVAVASVDRSAGAGARLRLKLHPGQDRTSVAGAVAATLAERFAITVDPAAIRSVTEPGRPTSPSPRSPASPGPLVARRASIRHLEIVHRERQVHVTIGLERDDRRVEGVARCAAGADGLLHTVAAATTDALRQLSVLPFELVVVQVAHEPDESPPRMVVAVRLTSDRGTEHLLGAAVVRDDPEAAVVRATLDAVNRRVEPLLQGIGAPRSGPPA